MRRRLVFHAHSAHSAQLNLIFSSAFAWSTYFFCPPPLSLAHLLTLPIILHNPPPPLLSLLSCLCAVNCLHTIALLPVSSCRTQLLLLPLLLLPCLLLPCLLLLCLPPCLLLLFFLPHLQVICWPAPATTPASGLNFWRGLFVRQD